MPWYDPRTWGQRSTALALRSESAEVIAPPARPIVRSTRGTSTQDPARFGELERTAATMARCFAGDVSGYVDTCKSVRRYDGRLDAVCAKRALAIQGRRWALKPPPGYETDRDALANCALVTAQINDTKGFATKLGHLGHAVLEGHAGLQHVWYRNLRGEIATAPREIHPRLFGWDTSTGEAGIYADGVPTGTASKLTALVSCPNEFVFHNPIGGRADDPWLRGAMRSRVLASLTKRMGVRWWLKLLERWGQPQVVGINGDTSPGNEDGDAKIIEALRELGTDWRAVLPAGTDIKTISADVKSDLHEKWVLKCDADDAIAILGQNLSTEVAGGSFAAARAHAWVLATILEADLAELQETITDQWIEPIIRFNRPGSPVPWLFINPAPLSELKPEDVALRDSKGRAFFSAAEYRSSKGYDLRPEDAEPEGVVVAVPAGAIEAGPKVDEIAKALDLARVAGLQATQESVAALVAGLGLATEKIPDGAPQPKPIALAPTDIAKVVTVGEARGSQGLAPMGDARDALTITELDAQIVAAAEKAKAAALAPPPPVPVAAGGAPPPSEPPTPG